MRRVTDDKAVILSHTNLKSFSLTEPSAHAISLVGWHMHVNFPSLAQPERARGCSKSPARRTTDLLSFNTLSSSSSNERTVVLSPRALRAANGTNKQRCSSLPRLSHVLLRSMQVSEANQPCSLHAGTIRTMDVYIAESRQQLPTMQ